MMMKHLLLTMTVVAAVGLAGCNNGNKYAEQGQAFARSLDELVQKKDTAAILELDKAIRDAEAQIAALNDSAAITGFREAIKEARDRTLPFITTVKVDKGEEVQKVLQQAQGDVLNGDVSIHSLTDAIDALIEKEQQGKTEK